MSETKDTRLDPAAWIKNYVTSGMEKTWVHDRISTIGSSEVFGCLRRVIAAKLDLPPDAGFDQSFGAMRRGDIIENSVFVPALMAGAASIGATLTVAGEKQQTLVDGYLSATPDGLVTGLARDCLAHLGIPDIGSDCVVTECKSYDPRVSVSQVKEEHSGQTIVQMGLIRHATPHRPNYAVVSYVNASFLDDVTQFVVPFDERIYDAAYQRTLTIMEAEDPWQAAPEGKIAGGKECNYCPYAGQCATQLAGRVPAAEDEGLAFDHVEMDLLDQLVIDQRQAKADEAAAAKRIAETDEAIKAMLRDKGRRKVAWRGWTISYYPTPGRVSLDREAAEKAGLDLSPFEKTGKPSEVLRISISK